MAIKYLATLFLLLILTLYTVGQRNNFQTISGIGSFGYMTILIFLMVFTFVFKGLLCIINIPKLRKQGGLPLAFIVSFLPFQVKDIKLLNYASMAQAILYLIYLIWIITRELIYEFQR